jgi:hypothetical protein
LKIKFIDLGIETRVNYDEDGFRVWARQLL